MVKLPDIIANPWVQLSSYLIGVAGFVITVLTIYFTRKTRRIYFTRRSFNLVRKNKRTVTSSLEVKFNGRTVEALTITKILIWNSGREVIRDSDLPALEKLRITTNGAAHLLESEIIQVSSESCNCRLLQLSPNEQKISFDFLDPEEGMVLQVAHTGTTGSALNVEGQIVGKGRVIEKQRANFLSYITRLGSKSGAQGNLPSRSFFGFMALFGLVIIVLAILDRFNAQADFERFNTVFRITTGLAGLLYFVIGTLALRTGLPKGLDRFNDSFSKPEGRLANLE